MVNISDTKLESRWKQQKIHVKVAIIGLKSTYLSNQHAKPQFSAT